jgi:hypothetical protein
MASNDEQRELVLRDLVTAVEHYVREVEQPATRRGPRRGWWNLETLVEMKAALAKAKAALGDLDDPVE